jgi:hypothetical protein
MLTLGIPKYFYWGDRAMGITTYVFLLRQLCLRIFTHKKL